MPFKAGSFDFAINNTYISYAKVAAIYQPNYHGYGDHNGRSRQTRPLLGAKMLETHEAMATLAGNIGDQQSLVQLRKSARIVASTLANDMQTYSDPWDLLQSSYSRDYLPVGSVSINRLSVRQVYVIPDILLSQFEGKECQCFMGLLPSIGRVWMSVDNRLYLWDFATGYD